MEFAFDVTLLAVARVKAESLSEARVKLAAVADGMDIGFEKDGVRFTEASTEGPAELIDE